MATTTPTQSVIERWRQMTGVLITRGVRVGFPPVALRITFGPDGAMASEAHLHAAIDMTSYWLDIAWDHLQLGEVARGDLVRTFRGQVTDEVGVALRTEFTACMQASTAAAIAIDAFYAAVKDRVVIPKTTLTAWRRKGTPRHKQVTETCRRGFRVATRSLPLLRQYVKEIYRFRDLAVHPSTKLERTVLHPILGIGTEWRFVSFGLESAQTLVGAATRLIDRLLEAPKRSNKELQRYCAESSPLVKVAVERWERRYGPIWPGSTT